jgi:hypothetical protein
MPPNSLTQDLRNFLRDLALESVRKLEKILLLCSCALGEALAAWCVRYSWSLAPRRLAVARELLILCGWAPWHLYYPLWLSGTLQSIALVIGWKEERVERDSIAFVANLNNVDVDMPLWQVEPWDESSCLLWLLLLLLLLVFWIDF